MKKILIFIVIVILFLVNLTGNEIKNIDNVQELAIKSKLIWSVDSAGEDILSAINSLNVDEETGNVYVFDRKHFKFYTFDKNGKFLFNFGRKGEGPGEFKWSPPRAFIIENYLIACNNGRITYFDKNNGKLGKIYNTVNFPTGKVEPEFFINKDCFVYIKEEKGEKAKSAYLIKYNIKTKKLKKILHSKIPKMVTKKSKNMTIRVMNPLFCNGIVSGYYKNHIYAGYNDKYFVDRYSIHGEKKGGFSIEGRKQKTISQKGKEEMYSELTINGNKPSKEFIKSMANATPDEYVYFLSFMWDKNGLMYVRLPDEDKDKICFFDVFNSKGEYIYKLKFKLPKPYIKSDNYKLSGNYLYLRAYDSEEEEAALLKLEIKLPPVK